MILTDWPSPDVLEYLNEPVFDIDGKNDQSDVAYYQFRRDEMNNYHC